MKAIITRSEPTPPPVTSIMLEVSRDELTYLLRAVGSATYSRVGQKCNAEIIEGSVKGVDSVTLYRELGDAFNKVNR